MSLLKKLAKGAKKLDPVGSKVLSKAPLAKKVMGGSPRKTTVTTTASSLAPARPKVPNRPKLMGKLKQM